MKEMRKMKFTVATTGGKGVLRAGQVSTVGLGAAILCGR